MKAVEKFAPWIGALIACATLAYLGPTVLDRAATAQDEERRAAAEERFAKAARAICGENGAWTREGNTLQCFTHRGHKTITASVSK